MPGNLYIPSPQQGGQTNQMMNLLTQLALMKVAQNFREKEAAIEDLRATTREQTRLKTAATMEGWRTAEGEEQRAPGAGAVEIGGTKMMPPSGPQLTPEQQNYIGVLQTGPGKYHVYTKPKRTETEFLWEHGLIETKGGLYRRNPSDPMQFTKVGGSEVEHLRPTTDAEGQTVYPAVNKQTGEAMPDYNITLKGKPAKPAGGEYTPQQRIDDVRAYFSNRRTALSQAAPTWGKEELAPKMDQLDRQERAELWRAMNKQPTALELGKPVDEYGYYQGETRTGNDGKQYQYVGNDQWTPAGQAAVTGVRTLRPRGSYR